MRYSRFLRGGAIPVEDELDRARQWQQHERAHPRFHDITEPQQWSRDAEGHWVENPEYEEEYQEYIFKLRNLHYAGFNDRYDPRTDIGYIFSIHHRYGLDVILQIPAITFRVENFGTEAELTASLYLNEDGTPWRDDQGRLGYNMSSWAHDVFTEIRIEPGPHFIELNNSDTYHTPNHYHITLTHTYDVGKGYNWDGALIQQWIEAYNRIQARYNGMHARLYCDRWGRGYTFYINRAIVDGLPEYGLVNDPDLLRVFNVPNKYKEGDGFHISLLI